jgi:putative hydrolase of the HAD superfamily
VSAPEVVLFDLDDTLFAHRRAVSLGIGAHLHAVGTPFDAADAVESDEFWHALEEKHYHSYLAGELDFEGQRRARARDFAARHGVTLDDDAASAWFASYFEHYIANWALHDDTLPCLEQLRATIPGVRFGVITNGDLAFQRRKLAATGLDDRLEQIIASGELGIVKPDAAIFLHAAAAFGVEPGAVAYVGDRLRTDAIGAARAGLVGVWLNRAGTRPSAADEADARAAGVAEIRTLAELAPLLTSR